MPDVPGQLQTLVIHADTGQMVREIGSSSPASKAIQSLGTTAQEASVKITNSLTRAIENTTKAANALPSGNVQAFFQKTVQGGLQAVVKLAPVASEIGQISRALSVLSRTRDPQKLVQNLGLVEAAFRAVAEAASVMGTIGSKRISMAASNVDFARTQLQANLTTQRRATAPRTEASSPTARGAAAAASGTAAAAANVDLLTQNLAKMVGADRAAGDSLKGVAANAMGFVGALNATNISKHRLETNLGGEFLVALGKVRGSVQDVSRMIGGAFVSSLERASTVYNMVFIKSFTRNLSGLTGTFDEIVNALKNSDAQGSAALEHLGAEHKKLADMAQSAFHLSAEGANVWVQTMVATLDPMKSITAARESDAKAQVQAGQAIVDSMQNERAQVQFLSQAYAENAARTLASQNEKASAIVAGMNDERAQIQMLTEAYADNAARTLAAQNEKANQIVAGMNSERAQIRMLTEAYADNAARTLAAQNEKASAIVAGMNDERAQLRLLTEAYTDNAVRTLAAQNTKADAIITDMQRERKELDQLSNAYAENAQRTLASFNMIAQGTDAFNAAVGRTGSLASGFKAAMAGTATATAEADIQIRKLANDMGWSNKRAQETMKAMARVSDPMRAMQIGVFRSSNAFQKAAINIGIFGAALLKLKNPFAAVQNNVQAMTGALDRSGNVLSKVGMAFGALFIIDRIGQLFSGLAGAMIDLAKQGGKLQAQQISYLVTAKNVKISQEDAMKAVDDVSSVLLTQQTAYGALQTLLRAGLGLPQAVQQLHQFEEAMIASGKAESVNEDVLKAAEALRDRQTRQMGKITGLQLNFGQALRIARKGVDSMNTGLAEHGKRLMSVAREAQIWSAGLGREIGIIAGVSAAVLPTLVGQLGFLDKQMQTLKNTIGLALAPILAAFVSVINDVLMGVVRWVKTNPDLIRTIGLAVAAIGLMTSAVTTLSIAFLTLTTLFAFLPGIGLAIVLLNVFVLGVTAANVALFGARETLLNIIGFFAALGMVVFQTGKFLVSFTKVVSAAFGFLSSLSQVGISAFQDIISIVGDLLSIGGEMFLGFVRPVGESINKIGKAFSNLIQPVVDFAKTAYSELSQVYLFMKDSFGPVLNAIVKVFSKMHEIRTGKTVEVDVNFGDLKTPDSIETLNERWQALLATFQTFKGIDFGKAGEFGNKIKGIVDEALKLKFDLGSIKGKDFHFDEWVEGADRAGHAMSRLQSNVQTIIDRLQDLQQTTKNTIREAFMGENSFIGSIGKFADDYDKAAREIQQAIDKSALAFNVVKVGPQEQNAEKNRKLADEMRDQATKLISDMRVIFDEANTQFIQRAFDEELAGLNDIVDMRLSGEKIVREAQARGAARSAALEIEAVHKALELKKISAEDAAKIELDIEQALMDKILEARMRSYTILKEQIRAIGEIVTSEIQGLFDTQARNQASLDRQRQESDARLREQQLIQEINQTAQAENERQMRILAVHAETQAEIRRMNEQTGNVVTRIWDKVSQSLRDALIKRVVDEAITNKIMPAVREFLDKGATKGLLGTASAKQQRGEELIDALKPLTGLKDALKTSLDEEKIVLEDILTILTRIASDEGVLVADVQKRQFSRTPNGLIVPGHDIGDVTGQVATPSAADPVTEVTKRVLTTFGQLQETLVKVDAAALAAVFGLESLGVNLPKGVKTAVAVITALTAAMTILRSLGILKAQTDVKQISSAAITSKALDVLAVSAGKAAGALAAVGIGGSLPFGFDGGGGNKPGTFVEPQTSAARGGLFMHPAITRIAEQSREIALPLDTRTMGMLANALEDVQRGRMRGGYSSREGSLQINIPIGPQIDGVGLAKELKASTQKIVERHTKKVIRESTVGMGGSF